MDGIAHVSWITGEVCEASVVQDAIKTKVLDMSFAVKSEGAFIAEWYNNKNNSSEFRQTDWHMDSGASTHMVSNKNFLSECLLSTQD